MVADELRRQADRFIELDALSGEIARTHQHREPVATPRTALGDEDELLESA